jgi:hypothetical protein
MVWVIVNVRRSPVARHHWRSFLLRLNRAALSFSFVTIVILLARPSVVVLRFAWQSIVFRVANIQSDAARRVYLNSVMQVSVVHVIRTFAGLISDGYA